MRGQAFIREERYDDDVWVADIELARTALAELKRHDDADIEE